MDDHPVDKLPAPLPVPPDELRRERSAAQGRIAFTAVISTNIFGLILAGIYEFLSLRGVVNLAASRIVLVGVWVISTLLAWLILRAKYGQRHAVRLTIVSSFTLSALLFVLDAIVPVPQNQASNSFVRIRCGEMPIPVSDQSDAVILVDPALMKFGGFGKWFTYSSKGRPLNYPEPADAVVGKLIYRCEVAGRPRDTGPLSIDLKVINNATYWDDAGRPTGCDSTVGQQRISLQVPSLAAGEKFQFYVYNSTQDCVQVVFPQAARSDNENIPLRVDGIGPAGISFTPMARSVVRARSNDVQKQAGGRSKGEPDSSKSNIAIAARTLSLEIKGFMLNRRAPNPSAGRTQEQSDSDYASYQQETEKLFTEKFGRLLVEIQQRLRLLDLGSWELDWYLGSMRFGTIEGGIPQSLEVIADRLGVEEGISSLKLPYHRVLLPADAHRITTELRRASGRVLVAFQERDPDSQMFAAQIQGALRSAGWMTEIHSTDKCERNGTSNYLGLAVVGDGFNRPYRTLLEALGSARMGPVALGAEKGEKSLDAVVFVCEIPRW